VCVCARRDFYFLVIKLIYTAVVILIAYRYTKNFFLSFFFSNSRFLKNQTNHVQVKLKRRFLSSENYPVNYNAFLGYILAATRKKTLADSI